MAAKVPAGATVRVTCTGGGCPYAKKSFVAERAEAVNLESRFRHRRLDVGDRITVTIRRLHAATTRYSYTIRSHQAPLVYEAS